MVMHHTLLDPRNADKRVFFIGSTITLLEQQKSYFSHETHHLFDNATATLFGDMNPRTRSEKLQRSHLVFITPQLFYNFLKSGELSLANIALIVFDEVRNPIPAILQRSRLTHFCPLAVAVPSRE